MFDQWGTRYMADQQRRFSKNSRGGGGWAPLKASTLRSRRTGRKVRTAKTTGKADKRFKKKTAGSAAILNDTGTMFAAMSRGAPGNLHQHIPLGIRVGFGPTGHPEGNATIADIAGFHNTGAGRNPKRVILGHPSPQTVRGMMEDARRAHRRMFKRHEVTRRGGR